MGIIPDRQRDGRGVVHPCVSPVDRGKSRPRFALLPGGNAAGGTPDQFHLVEKAVVPLRLKLHILPGDHDFKPGSLATIHRAVAAKRLPYTGGIAACSSTWSRPGPAVPIFAWSPRSTAANQNPDGALFVRAKVFGDAPIEAVEVSVDDREWVPITPAAATLWQATVARAAQATGVQTICVRARDIRGRHDEDRIEPSPRDWGPSPRALDGSDRIGIWPAKDLPDAQLGPNRKGRKW